MDKESPDSALEEQLGELVERIDLTNVRLVKWSGDLQDDAPFRPREMRLNVSSSFRATEKGFDCRYEVRVSMSGKTSKESATVDVDAIASFSMDEETHISKNDATVLAEQMGFYVVYPYVREALQTMSVRLGLGPVTLGLLQQRDGRPSATSVTIATISE